MEVVRLKGNAFTPEDIALSRDTYLLQVWSLPSKFKLFFVDANDV